MGNLFVLFWAMYDSVTRPRDIKSFNISTAYDVWFSRYRPYNLMLATGSALEFKGVPWAVYVVHGNAWVNFLLKLFMGRLA